MSNPSRDITPFDFMIVAPHPDDGEIGMGGTMAALVSQGASVVLVDLTDGEPTPYGTPEIRAAESAAASKALGLVHRVQVGIKNREVFDNVINRKKLAEVIRQFRPKVLFGPYWEDAHPDHIEACKLVEGARFYAKLSKSDMIGEPHYPTKLLHFFSTHIRLSFKPSFIFDISQVIDNKIAAIECYKSQFANNPKNQGVIESVKDENAFWGRQIRCAYGEPFLCRESLGVGSEETLLELCGAVARSG